MRYENLRFEDVELNLYSVDLQIAATEELIDLTNDIRRSRGCTDLVEVDADNEVYYNFYLVCYPEKHGVKILAICNHGELDDYKMYMLPMNDEEKESVTFQLIQELMKAI